MSRPSKYNEKVSRHLVELIGEGFSFKDACSQVGISEDSFARWRKTNPDFNKKIKSTLKQKKLSRGMNNHPEDEKPLETPLNASENISGKPEMWMGLPALDYLPEEYEPNKQFYYKPEDSVQFYDSKGIRYSCPSDLWSREHSVNLYGDEWAEELTYF